MSALIAPSILAGDLARLADQTAALEAAGADLLHVDVMDGRFVPNLTMGIPIVAALKKATRLALDVHLMIVEPEKYVPAFVEAGAARISVHAEVSPHLHRTLTQIRDLGAKAGVAINPSTAVESIADVLGVCDHVLVMSVNPGFSGQAFIPHSLEKVRAVRARLTSAGSRADIEVDGGVSPANAGDLVRAGATMLVAGSSVFAHGDLRAAIAALHEAAAAPAVR